MEPNEVGPLKAKRLALAAIAGPKVKTLREARGWTQAKLSEVAQVDDSTVGRLEGAKALPWADGMAKIAQALGVTPNQLTDPRWIVADHPDGGKALALLAAPPKILKNHDPALAISCPRCGWLKWKPFATSELGLRVVCEQCEAVYTVNHRANIADRKSEPRPVEQLKIPGQVGVLVDDGKATVPGVEVVGDLTRQLLEGMGLPGLIPLLEHQLAKGLDKYQTPLMTHNGRSALGDAIWEGVDQLNYLVQLRGELSDAYQALRTYGALPGFEPEGAAKAKMILGRILGVE